MIKKLVIALCVVSMAADADASEDGVEVEVLLSVLSGVHGLNRASVCVLGAGPVRRCEAALVAPQWAVARRSCLLRATAGFLRVVRASDDLYCADVEAAAGSPVWGMRRVLSLVYPSLHYDLALLPLHRAYATIDHHANTSSVNRFLKEWEPWMSVDHVLPDPRPSSQTLSFGHKHVLLSTPMRMLATTVLLPMLSMLALFMFVMFCTGERDPVPYEGIEDSEAEKTDHSTDSLTV